MKSLCAFLFGTLLAGCTTIGSGTHHDPTLADGDDKAGTKVEGQGPAPTPDQTAGTAGQVPPTGPGPAAGTPAATPPPPAPSIDEQLAFVRKQSIPGAPFNDQDRQLVTALPSSPQAGSVAEAALAIGLVRLVLNPLGGEVATFHEADLTKGQAPPTANSFGVAAGGAVGPAAPGASAGPPSGRPPTLEKLCHEHGLNLPDALSENPLLGTAGVGKLVVAAMAADHAGELSAEFKNEVNAALKKQANLWSEVSGAAAPPATDAAQTAPQQPPPQPAVTAGPTANSSGVVDDAPPNPAELVGGDAVLAESQALADRGNYQAAIKRAGGVPDGSPLKPQAQEKVKEFSNLAVQELRKKAASAFQSAMPVADQKIRAGYLQQAKAFLEEAIKDYPDATQLPTVRDNLRVISRDLDALESGQAKKGE